MNIIVKSFLKAESQLITGPVPHFRSENNGSIILELFPIKDSF